jgi:signal transduction histidine kinase
VEQALLNLVDNAVKYAADGRDVTLELRVEGGAAALSVSDRGPGVAPKHRRRIFEKFYRVDDSLTARQPGAGLGLSIARALMRDQGGDLTFEPRPGGGSRFTMRFPSAPPPASAPMEGENHHADPAHPDR